MRTGIHFVRIEPRVLLDASTIIMTPLVVNAVNSIQVHKIGIPSAKSIASMKNPKSEVTNPSGRTMNSD